jgi:hypothetical protein
MLAQQSGISDADDRSREPFLSTVTGFVLLGALLYVLQMSYEQAPGVKVIDDLLARVGEGKRQLAGGDPDQVKDLPGDLDRLLNRAIEGQRTRAQELQQEHKTQEARAAESQQHFLEDLRTNVVAPVIDEKWLGQNSPSAAKRAELLGELQASLLWVRQQYAWFPPPEDRTTVLSTMSGPPANLGETQWRAARPEDVKWRLDEQGRPQLPADNSGFLGRSLFTDYLVPVELGGILLLVATVGAIAIAHRPRTTT